MSGERLVPFHRNRLESEEHRFRVPLDGATRPLFRTRDKPRHAIMNVLYTVDGLLFRVSPV